MTIWFTENALVPLIVGSCLTFIFLGLAFSFRDRAMFYIGLILLALTAGVTITERLIVTDQETVQQIVRELAVAAEKNDVNAILSHVSQKAQDTRNRIKSTMPRYTIHRCRIVGFKDFTESENADPPRAVIEFVAIAQGTGKMGSGTFNPLVTLTFEKESDGKWRVIDYAYSDPRSNVQL